MSLTIKMKCKNPNPAIPLPGAFANPSQTKQRVRLSYIPLISDCWTDYFTWKGNGPIPAEEKNKLRRLVRQAHHEGRRVRFWNTDVTNPQEQLILWKELRQANVDLIGSDKLIPLREFLLNNPQK